MRHESSLITKHTTILGSVNEFRYGRFLDQASQVRKNECMQADAHLHAPDLAQKEPDFTKRLSPENWRGALVAHDKEELSQTQLLRKEMPPTLLGFGIHPQGVRWDTLDLLTQMAKERQIDFIGETGFDLFGDRPERVRNVQNLDEQRRAFEFQVSLAARYDLPVVIHMRKATDVVMGYARALARVPAVVFHCWPGRLAEAQAMLKKGINAYFSMGTPILRNASHALETCEGLPQERLLSETDAPFQPPYGEAWTSCADLSAVVAKVATVRGIPIEEAQAFLYENFKSAYGTTI